MEGNSANIGSVIVNANYFKYFCTHIYEQIVLTL